MAFCMRGKGIKPKIYCMTTPRAGSWWNEWLKRIDPNKVEIIQANMFSLLEKDIITQETLDLVKMSCIDENMLRQELYGELVENSTNGVLFSNELLNSCYICPPITHKGYAIGVDCSGLGNDLNVIVVRKWNKILKVVRKQQATAAELCSIIRALIIEFGEDELSHICIDEAYGLDLYNRLRECGISSTLVAFGGKPTENCYSNNRSEIYCEMKKYIEEYGMIGLDNDTKRELNNTHYLLNGSNRIQIIPKSDIKLILGHSPDTADALALTFYQKIMPKLALKAQQIKDYMDMSDN